MSGLRRDSADATTLSASHARAPNATHADDEATMSSRATQRYGFAIFA